MSNFSATFCISWMRTSYIRWNNDDGHCVLNQLLFGFL